MSYEEKGPGVQVKRAEAEVEGVSTQNVPGTDVSGNSERPTPKGDPDASIGFLRKWSAEGPWALTSIQTDRKAIDTRTFYPRDEAALAQWLASYNGSRNIYFHVNPVLRDVKKKAEREDIKELAWLHVDVDPRAGEDITEERSRALALLTEKLPKGIPAPTCIVFSGGGYQAFWRLKTPAPIDGELAKAEDLKRYNQQLERLFGGDNCHNIDRIMRLPGTLNIPDARKLKKGRQVELAKVVEFNDLAYELSEFIPAPAATSAGSESHAVAINLGNIVRLADVNELDKYRVPDRVKVAIVYGKHPDEPLNGDNSRSAWLFYVCCNLVRCGVPDEMIYAIITDKGFGISESVIELGSRAEKYALRQIERAHEEVAKDPPRLTKDEPMRSAKLFIARTHPTLMHYNDDWLAHDGAAYVERQDATIKSEIYKFLDSAVATVIRDEVPVDVPFNPNRNKVADVVDALKAEAHRPRDIFAPPCWLNNSGPPAREILACRNGLLHLPKASLLPPSSDFFTRNALAFDFDPHAPSPEKWLDFLKQIWPGGDERELLQEMFGYLITPDTSMQKIFLFVGPKRSGKGTIARILTRLVGEANRCAPTLDSLSDSFGLEPLIGKQLATVSDMRIGHKTDQAKIAENLLRISGEDDLDVNRKYKSAWTGRLGVRFLIFTNEMPKFRETSGALASRFVPFMMTESFYGREDLGLEKRLASELPGILNWAIEGWRKLQARGYFKLPERSREAKDEIERLAEPVKAFLDDILENGFTMDPEGAIAKKVLWDRWKGWCEERDLRAGDMVNFAKKLMEASGRRIDSKRLRASSSDSSGIRPQVPYFVGIRDTTPF